MNAAHRLAILCLAVLALAVASAPAGAATQKAKPPRPSLVPNSTLPGPGAFMGPVRTVPANGIRIGYRTFGKGPDLVLIQGDTAPMSLWTDYLMQALASRFRVTVFDNRGVGYSTDDTSVPMTVKLLAQDTAAFIRALGLRRPAVAGWSMGGQIGIIMAELYPNLMGHLITSGGDAGSRHTAPPVGFTIPEINSPNLSYEVLLDLLFPQTPAGQAAVGPFVEWFVEVPQEQVSPTTLARQARAEIAFFDVDWVWDRLGTIRTPTLITNGQLDRAEPRVNARRLHKRIPGSRLSIFEGAAHGMMFQSYRSFAKQVARFVKRTPPGPRPLMKGR